MRVTTLDNRPATAIIRPSARRAGEGVLVVTDDYSHAVLLGLAVGHVTHTILTTALDDTSSAAVLDKIGASQ